VGKGTRGHVAYTRGLEAQLIRETVQRCKSEGASIEYGVLSIGEPQIRVPGLSNREPGTGYQVRVRVRVLNLHLMLNTRT
jgi:hypothetical protein